jgi:hypothetical protein
MNKYFKWVLLLQIPNILIVSLFLIFAIVFGIAWVISQLTLSSLIWIIGGTIYALLNIFSIILLVSGAGNED